MVDKYGRKIDYLRVSVTERCNFRCAYCMPNKPFEWVPNEELLSFDEMFLFIKSAIDAGITKIRITGGEPTLREDLDHFLRMIFEYAPATDLALTTNGFLLAKYASRYADAGLKRINISLDSLNKETAKKIAGGKDMLDEVLLGIDEAIKVGLRIKINTVVLKDSNDNELVELVKYAKSKKIMIRFIEYMENSYAPLAKGLKSDEIQAILRSAMNFKPIEKEYSSPARIFQTDDGYMFGIIEPHKDDFCTTCNRIRLTAEGLLVPCLYFDEAISIKDAVRSKDIDKAIEIFKTVIYNKPEKNRWGGDGANHNSDRAFYQTGG